MEPLRVAVPLGIGDCHWVCTKLEALKERTGRPLHVFVNNSPNHKSEGYLAMVPFIDQVEMTPESLYDVNVDMVPGYNDPRWATLDGSGPWRSFDYLLIANGHLEQGKSLESWLPDLATHYDYQVNVPAEAIERARSLAPPGTVLLYPSGVGANLGFHLNTWTPAHWATVVDGLNRRGIVPAFVGADTEDDNTIMARIRDTIARNPRGYLDLVGKTDIPTICALIDQAGAWCGLNSGLGIYSAMRRVPTLMLWADSRYPMNQDRKGVYVGRQRNRKATRTTAGYYMHPNMQRSWLSPEQLLTYRTLSYGSPGLTPKAVIDTIAELVTLRRAA